MRIGTPLSPSATKIMLLGSGELGKMKMPRRIRWRTGPMSST